MKPNQRLRQQREVHGWSQAKVAKEVGTDPATVSRWERGLSFPYPYFREKLCKLFGCNADELGLMPGESEKEEPVHQAEATSEKTPVDTTPSGIFDPAVPLRTGRRSELVGRDSLLLDLKLRLYRGSSIALYGLPGVGKTALATYLAHDNDIREHFRDGILWAGLGPQPHVSDLLRRWGTLLGVRSFEQAQDEREALAVTIRSAIGKGRMLLVIDDAWTAEDALAFQVAGHECACLITTRFPHVALRCMVDEVVGVHELSEDDGVQLLMRLAPEIATDETEVLRELERAVGGLPLALTLIGNYLRVQVYYGQPRRYRAAIERLRAIEGRLYLTQPQAPVERHPSLSGDTPLSLQSIIAVSDQLLQEQAQQALRALSVFPAKPNTFSEEAALAVSVQSVEILDEINGAGLLESSGPGRYMLHQIIADYARLHVKQDEGPQRRMVNYFARYVEEHAADYALLEMESNNIQVALDLAWTHDMKAEFIQSVLTLGPFLLARGMYVLAEEYLQKAHQVAIEQKRTTDLIWVLLYLGEITEKRGKFAVAASYLEQGLLLARSAGDQGLVCRFLLQLGQVADDEGNSQQAGNYLREGLELAKQIGHYELVCVLLTKLGGLVREQGNYVQAGNYLREGLELAKRIEHQEYICLALIKLGSLTGAEGNYEQAMRYYQEGLVLARRIGHKEYMVSLLASMGWIAGEQGKHNDERAYYQEGLVLARQIGSTRLIVNLLTALGCMEEHTLHYELAEHYYQEGLELSRQTGHQECLSLILTNFGSLKTRTGCYEQAEAHFVEAMQVARQINKLWIVGGILHDWGVCHLRQCNFVRAAELFRELLQSYPDGHPSLQASALYGLARVALGEKKIDEARQAGQESLTIFESIGHRKTEEVRSWLARLS